MENSLNNLNNNIRSYHIDANSIKLFGDKIIKENNKLLDIIMKMYDDSIKYDDMVNNKAGNLYKEVMLQVLLKEKEKITNNNEELNRIYTNIYNTYTDTINKISSSVRG